MTRDMQDKLEKFVRENKEEFDSLSPNEAIWEGIKDKMGGNRYIRVYRAGIFRAVFSAMSERDSIAG